jgi:transcriptional regulator with XRE-family HTH domain
VLVEIRTEAGVTQRELARRLDRAHSYVSRIEKGDRRLDVPEMIQWCEAVGADPVSVMKRMMHRRADAGRAG